MKPPALPGALAKIAERAAAPPRERDWVTPKRLRPKCGARTRKGTPCQRLPVWDKENDRPRNGRCPNHGGLSTGARTPEGMRRALEALARGSGHPLILNHIPRLMEARS